MTKDHPLGLPEGSIRAILAIGLTVGAFLLFLFKKNFEVGSFLSLVGLPIGLYFGQYINPAGGGTAGQVQAAVGDTLAGVNTMLTPVTDLVHHTVTQLGEAAGTGVAVATGATGAVGSALGNGALNTKAVDAVVDLTKTLPAVTNTVGGIVSGVVPAIGPGGGIFPK